MTGTEKKAKSSLPKKILILIPIKVPVQWFK